MWRYFGSASFTSLLCVCLFALGNVKRAICAECGRDSSIFRWAEAQKGTLCRNWRRREVCKIPTVSEKFSMPFVGWTGWHITVLHCWQTPRNGQVSVEIRHGNETRERDTEKCHFEPKLEKSYNEKMSSQFLLESHLDFVSFRQSSFSASHLIASST